MGIQKVVIMAGASSISLKYLQRKTINVTIILFIKTSNKVSGCCLTSTQQFSSYLTAITSFLSGPLCTRSTRMVAFLLY